MLFRILVLVLWSLPGWATVTVGDCPEAFEGQVKEVIEEVGPTSAYSVQKVVFSNHRTLKGEVKEQVLIDMLANGPFEIGPGKEYRVQLRDGKLCWIEQI